MSKAGGYLKTISAVVNGFEEGKPHSSITDWIEVLSSDRYEELSLDGIPELVESINIQGSQGTTEAARAIRKKLKYGNVHRQLRALVILRALTENAGKGFQMNWANQELLTRLKDMASDSLLDPKVKKRLTLVFHAWSIQYKDNPRMTAVQRLYAQHGGAGPGVRKATTVGNAYGEFPSTTSSSSPTSATSTRNSGGFNDDIWDHSWAPSRQNRGPDTYTDLAQAKDEARRRQQEREQRIAMEQREAEIDKREREVRRQKEMAELEQRRRLEAQQEAERRQRAKEAAKNRSATSTQQQVKRPPFDYAREKPQILISVASAIQAANNLVNAVRHIDRESENVTESPRVQDCLDKAKATRRVIIRYLQLVHEEGMVGTLLDANEKVVEAIQLYDKLSKPAVLDSDSDSEAEANRKPNNPKEMDRLAKRMEAQKLEADRTGELQRLQDRQKVESRRRMERQQSRRAAPAPGRGTNAHPDLQDLDFGASPTNNSRLPAPIRPDDNDDYRNGTLSDFSDYDYDSSDAEYQAQSRSRRQSQAAGRSGRASMDYKRFDDEPSGRRGLLDDPFGDPDTPPINPKQRMQWAEI